MSEAPLQPGSSTVEARSESGPASRGLWGDAWHELVRNPVFVVSLATVLTMCSMAAFPGLWTTVSPRECDIMVNNQGPGRGHVFGTTVLGCDMYSQVVYGARPSIVIAVIVTACTALLGGSLGVVAGYYGGWVDTVISRLTDVVLGLPFLLGALVFLALLGDQNMGTVTIVLVALGWTQMTRIVRGAVLAIRAEDYVQAARALGASDLTILRKHIVPNALAPIIVLSTLYVGTFVSAEATLTFLGVGLQLPAVSWGIIIAQGQELAVNGYPHLLAFPSAFLIVTVLSFILLGDALREALDPRGR